MTASYDGHLIVKKLDKRYVVEPCCGSMHVLLWSETVKIEKGLLMIYTSGNKKLNLTACPCCGAKKEESI